MNGSDNKAAWPDHHLSSVSLIGSIAAFFGLKAPYGSLKKLDNMLEKKSPRNVILLLLDGLGCASLIEALPESSFLRRSLFVELSSVFPPTTVAATASLRSGLPPVRHGRLGWTMYFPQIGKSVDVFSNLEQFHHTGAADYHVADRYLPYPDLTARLERLKVMNAASISAHDKLRAESFDEIIHQVLKAVEKPGRNYLFAYFKEPDSSMHQYGIHSAQALGQIHQLDRDCEKLCKALPDDSLLLITADHGLVDAEPAVVEEHPLLAGMLLRPPVLEPRCAAFYLKPGFAIHFPAAFHEAFGGDFLLLTTGEALEQELFGPGLPLPGIEQYLGDYLAVATGNRAIFQRREHCKLIGMHAGLTKNELRVPLIIPGI